jgi:hypothetical protein
MKVYTVQYQEKIDYDFSVIITNHGCFKNKEDAICELRNVVEKVKEEHKKDIEEYSNTDIYPNEDKGALYLEEDDDFFYISFGYEEYHQSHTVWIDEWEVK